MMVALARRSSRQIAIAVVMAAALFAASILHAQNILLGGRRGAPPRFAKSSDFDGSFTYCRAIYRSTFNTGSGSGWDTDYPAADNNFSVRLAELTRVRVRFGPDRQPDHVVVPLVDPLLFRCPLLFIEDTGGAQLTDEEVRQLRDYLLKGGFLWSDDSWGSANWHSWIRQVARVLPPGEFPLIDIPAADPIMHLLYDVREVPQVPSMNHWYRSGGQTSENGRDSATVFFKGIRNHSGQLMVVMTHNTDIADSWEREGDNAEFFDLFSPRGYAIGVNVVLHALTH
jgi:Domain of unknown function (DUF4159)